MARGSVGNDRMEQRAKRHRHRSSGSQADSFLAGRRLYKKFYFKTYAKSLVITVYLPLVFSRINRINFF